MTAVGCRISMISWTAPHSPVPGCAVPDVVVAWLVVVVAWLEVVVDGE